MKVTSSTKARISAYVAKVLKAKAVKEKTNPKTEKLAALIDAGSFEGKFDTSIRNLFKAALDTTVRDRKAAPNGWESYKLGGLYVCTRHDNGHDYGSEPFLVCRSVATHSGVRGLRLRGDGTLMLGNTPHTHHRPATTEERINFFKRIRTVHEDYEDHLQTVLDAIDGD